MELIAKERDRLLRRTARMVGLVGTISALACLTLPGVLSPAVWGACLPLFAVLLVVQARLTTPLGPAWISAALACGLTIIAVIVATDSGPRPGLATGVGLLAGMGLASFGVLLTGTLTHRVLLAALAVGSAVLVQLASLQSGWLSDYTAGTLVGWLLAGLVGHWLNEAVPRAARRIRSVGRAHFAERQATEAEAQRRQSARLLHDTVLATLTLLAHSGVGVSADALRQQAADDARLLRQLRLGGTPTPQSSGQYNLERVEETVLGTTLESVKHRFNRMGLEVSWHGTGQVLLPTEVLDAFLMALSECLENVRRHAGVNEAHVTITDDETTVRALVTDSGVGFDLDEVGDTKLGFRESVVARLRDVGGNARLFSAPGQGTTVVLEVPR